MSVLWYVNWITNQVMKKLLIILGIIFSYYYSFSEILINEVCTSNSSSCFDEDMQASDWIELINNGSEAVNLAGYRLSDKKDYENAWILADTLIAPNNRMLIFASGKNRHTSNTFEIKASGMGINSFVHSDAFRFEYIEVKGDFDIKVRVKSLRNAELFGNAGLVYKEDLTDRARFVATLGLVQIRLTDKLLYRDTLGNWPKNELFNITANYPNKYLGLKKVGDTLFSIVYDTEWYPYQVKKMYFPVESNTQYVGLAVSAYTKEHYATACFDEMFLNGKKISFKQLKTAEFNCPIPGKSCVSREFHTNFSLKKSGEKLYLWNNKGELIDTLDIPYLPSDFSYGRYPDGEETFCFFDNPSPGFKSKKGFKGITDKPSLSESGGLYDGTITLKFNAFDKETEIYYTTDGSAPDTSSFQAESEKYFTIDTSTVIRARAFKKDFLPGATMTHSFIIGENTRLPVFSLAGNPKDFFDEDSGLFSPNTVYHELRIPVSFEYWDRIDKVSYANDATVVLQGTSASTQPPQSMRFLSNSKYGESSFNVSFFGKSSLSTFNKFVLRNSGQDKTQSYIRDGLFHSFTKDIENIDALEYRPAIVYINGKFWSLMNLRARFDDDYIAAKYNIPAESVSRMEVGNVLKSGSCRTYMEVIDTLSYLNFNDEETYSFFSERMDLENLADYMAIEMYSGHIDFPHLNRKFWNSSEPGFKWRWFLYDLDLSLAINEESDWNNRKFEWTIEHCDSSDFNSMFSCMFAKLVQTTFFRNLFLTSVADILNSHFLPEVLIHKLDSVANLIKDEIPRQRHFWSETCIDWEFHIQRIKDFINLRPDFFRANLAEYFGLECINNCELRVNNNNAGKVKINRIQVDIFPWHGKYFCGVPVRLEAQANEGYCFEKWIVSDSILASSFNLYDSIVNVLLPDSIIIEALFNKETNTNESGVVINEIMYKAADDADSGDWIELHNFSEATEVNLKGWQLKDDNDDNIFFFDDDDRLLPGEYMVICRRLNLFPNIYPGIKHHKKELGFGLNSRDAVRLYDADGNLIDIVNFSDEYPWPDKVNGTGSSMELISPELDNSIGENWQASYVKGGTPGKRNSVWVSIKEYSINNKSTIKTYPNPAHSTINIEFDIADAGEYYFEIKDKLGRTYYKSHKNYLSKGLYVRKIDLSNNFSYPNGLYYIILSGNNRVVSDKVIVYR